MQKEKRRRNPKETHRYTYSYVSIRLRTALGSFSVLTDPAPLARLEIELQYKVLKADRLDAIASFFACEDIISQTNVLCQEEFEKMFEKCFPLIEMLK